MKKTLFTLLAGACSFGSLSAQGDESTIAWNETLGKLAGTAEAPIEKNLTELREEIRNYQDTLANPYIELLILDNVVINIDDTSLYCHPEGKEHGGPSGLAIQNSVTFNILTLSPFDDQFVGAAFGGFTEMHPNSTLTINLTENVVEHLKWNGAFADKEIMIAQIMSWSYFTDMNDYGTPTTIAATYEGKAANCDVGDYIFQGYISDLDELKEDGIALMRSDILTKAFDEGNSPWPGTTFALVARGHDAPDINVPEPATGTLSLLALAGLAARRRRK